MVVLLVLALVGKRGLGKLYLVVFLIILKTIYAGALTDANRLPGSTGSGLRYHGQGGERQQGARVSVVGVAGKAGRCVRRRRRAAKGMDK
jgi:hypothetical protein